MTSTVAPSSSAAIPPGWQATTLGAFVVLQRGFDLPARDRRAGKFKILSSAGIAGSHDQGPVKGPGLVVGRATNLGVPTWSDDDYWPLNTTLFVKDFRENDPRFVFYLFRNLDLSAYNSGSVQPMLNRNYVAKVPLVVPKPAEQRAIAATLTALDNKILSNQSLAATIEPLIAAIVTRALQRETHAIPVARLARFVNGGAYTKGATGSGRMVLRIAELNAGPGPSTVYNDLDVPDEKVARPGDLLMSWSGSLDIYRWARDEAIVNQHIFKVTPTSYPAWLVYERLRSVMSAFRAIAKDKATTMGHIQRGHLDSTTVLVPDASTVEQLDSAVRPLWERLLLADRETLNLAALRDALLPQMLSGRVRVAEAGLPGGAA